MFWLAFWLIVIGYFVIGATRLPKYYAMYYANERKEWSMILSVEQSQKEAFWYAFILMLVWPYYEAGKWFQNTIINQLTREERREAEYAKAQKIVDEWNAVQALKEQKEKEAFDRALKEP